MPCRKPICFQAPPARREPVCYQRPGDHSCTSPCPQSLPLPERASSGVEAAANAPAPRVTGPWYSVAESAPLLCSQTHTHRCLLTRNIWDWRAQALVKESHTPGAAARASGLFHRSAYRVPGQSGSFPQWKGDMAAAAPSAGSGPRAWPSHALGGSSGRGPLALAGAW